MTLEKDTAPAPRNGWYTFGNHFHWVGMQWLWGNGILARSVDDMLRFIQETGSPGNINFDSLGYEKLASEEPVAIEKLRAALKDGRLEVVGATFGQSYPLFHHGESAVRQLTYGLRSSVRVLDVRPRSFWEEEFYFFPQLPQMLTNTGYRYASLFFQWTWHTPELPKETAPAIRWTGIDGSKILTLPRSELNLHQWPEDVEELIRSGKLAIPSVPVVQQWVELLPSPEWMCRSELVAPGVQSLFTTSGIEFTGGTLSTVLDAVEHLAEDREYSMDEVFHGMTLGKNGNLHHQTSLRAENTLLAAEVFSVISGNLGRPYAHWGKYPAWELEEGWRELLSFQAHDNDECEGLNGHIGYFGVDRGIGLGSHVLNRTLNHLASALGDVGQSVVANPVGWDREAIVGGRRVTLPAFSASVADSLRGEPVVPTEVVPGDSTIILRRGDFEVEIDTRLGAAVRVAGTGFARGLGRLSWERDGVSEEFVATSVTVTDRQSVVVTRDVRGARVRVEFALADVLDALDISFRGDLGEGPDGRMHAALSTTADPDFDVARLVHDTPYAVSEVKGVNAWSRKYPTGAWMTSPQEFETVRNSFTGLQFVDMVDEAGHGVLWAHNGSQGFHRSDTGIVNSLSVRDPWDEDQFKSGVDISVRVVPHAQVSNAWRWKTAQEFVRVPLPVEARPTMKDAMHDLAASSVALFAVAEATGVVVTSLYRDSDFAGTGFDTHVNHSVKQPIILRFVEFEGVDGELALDFHEPILRAFRCSLLGEVLEEIAVENNQIALNVAPYEIGTIAVQLPAAPGEGKTLDDERGIWALVHHVGTSEN